MKNLITLYLFLFVLLLYPPLSAQEKIELSDDILAKLAVEEFDRGNNQKAVDLFKKAYEINSLAKYLFNIGKIYEIMGEHEQNIQYLRKFLKTKPSYKHRKAAEDIIKKSKNIIKEKKSEVIVATMPEDAEVYVGSGSSFECRTPCSLFLLFGEAKIIIKKPGFKNIDIGIFTRKGKDQAVNLKMEKETKIKEEKITKIEKRTEDKMLAIERKAVIPQLPEKLLPAETPITVKTEDEEGIGSTLKWVAAYSTAVPLALGGIWHYKAIKKAEESNNISNADKTLKQYSEEFWDKRHEAEDLMKTSYIFYGAAGGLAVTSFILFMMDDPGETSDINQDELSHNFTGGMDITDDRIYFNIIGRF